MMTEEKPPVKQKGYTKDGKIDRRIGNGKKYRKDGFPKEGRHVKPIDWNLVDNLLEAGCSSSQIAPHFDMHPQTFIDRVAKEKGMTFTAYSLSKSQKGESNIQLIQYAKSIGLTKKGDNTLLMFLGKVRLNQQEKKDDAAAPNDPNLNFADAFIHSEMARLKLEKIVQDLQEQVDALKPKTDSIIHGS